MSFVFGVIQNHKIIPSPNHISPPETLISASFSSHHCVVGCVPSCFLPSLPFLVKERMRLEREEATRQLEEETEVRFLSQGGLLTTFLPPLGCKTQQSLPPLFSLQNFKLLEADLTHS